MEYDELAVGMPVTLSHLMCVLFYTNFTDLQRMFKKHGCRTRFDHEPMAEVNPRNAEIGNWYKFLRGCVIFFGILTNKRYAIVVQ